ncbi:hypothetical protein [Ruminiclostridium cellobioparum]|nr:hypothetical protein [Ruminiclostridium cellobioparum]
MKANDACHGLKAEQQIMEGSIVADVRPVNSFSLLLTGYAQYESFGDVPF